MKFMKFILIISKNSIFALAFLTCFFAVSCSKILNKDPETTLDSKNVYRNIFDADAAVIGVYGKFMGLAKQYVLMNELRADLLSVTDNADNELREISTHSTTQNNSYTSPKPFYSLINECNDVLKNFDIMLKDNKFKITEYNQRYSDVACIRSWLYLQLGIHFGNIPYVTSSLDNVDAVVKDSLQFKPISFNTLLDTLIKFTSNLPYISPYSAGSSLLLTVDGSSTTNFFIEKNALLGDLNLWRGKYNAAATYYRALMEGSGYFFASGSGAYYDNFKVSNFSSIPGYLDISYLRYHENDLRSFIDNNTQGWRSIFANSSYASAELMWVLPFNYNFAPSNPFIEIFSNVGGKYLVKPSQLAIDYWNSQKQTNNFPYDARGLMTYRTINGQPVIVKNLYTYLNESSLLPTNVLQKNGNWFLLRAAAIHLRYAEAANRDGYSKLAYAFVNKGLGNTYTAPTSDVTNYQNTFDLPDPYKFDARNGTYPYFRGSWYRHEGIRGRANLVSTPAADTASTVDMENSIINESGLELAYEGYRWPDLLRVALRRNDPSFIADKVYAKLVKENNPAADTVRAKLLSRDYYLPFKW